MNVQTTQIRKLPQLATFLTTRIHRTWQVLKQMQCETKNQSFALTQTLFYSHLNKFRQISLEADA